MKLFGKSNALPRVVAVKDLVLFEGLRHHVAQIGPLMVEIVSELKHRGLVTQPDGSSKMVEQPRFQTAAFIKDLRWSDELKGWYIWGRSLSKGRGGALEDQRRLVLEMRDLGLIPARPGRMEGSAPAGGEHLNLHLALFANGINWTQEIANVRRGDGLTTKAKSAVESYRKLFREKLTDGYAEPDVNDSYGEG